MPLYRRPGSPYWWVRIGRKARRSTGTADREKAEEFERVLAERLWRRDKLGDRSAVSWQEVSQRWLNESARKRSRDREFLAWMTEKGIGAYPLCDVADPDAIERIRRLAAKEGWSQSTIDRLMNTIRAVLRRCVAWRFIGSVPEIPMYRPQESEPRWLTPPEFARLHAELPPHLQACAEFAVLTGLRMRAMLGLQWSRVDLDAKRAWIPAAQMKGGKTQPITLSDRAVELLRSLEGGKYVFRYNGRRIHNCRTAAFQKAVKRAGVGPLRWHDLRHTFAAWAVQSGVTLQELMALGGWSSYRMALRYGHLAPSQLTSAAERVAQTRAQNEAKSSGTDG